MIGDNLRHQQHKRRHPHRYIGPLHDIGPDPVKPLHVQHRPGQQVKRNEKETRKPDRPAEN